MNKYDCSFFDRGVERRGTACEKWDGISQRLGHDVLPMWVADMDFACADEIMDALDRLHELMNRTEEVDYSESETYCC